MKNYFTLFLLFFTLVSFSQTEVKIVNIEKSQIFWKGKKVIGGAHKGTIKLISGQFIFKNNKISNGEFLIDMTSIICIDLKGKSKDKLERHLNSAHFFDVSTYSTAKLLFTKVRYITDTQYEVTGDITIKNHSFTNTFSITITNNKATGNIKIKRDEYHLRFGTGFFGSIANKAISNTFILDFNLTF